MEGDALLNLLTNVPPNLFNKIADLSNNSQFLTDKVELEVIFGENVDNVRQAVDNIGGTFENLGFGFGIVTLPVDKIKDISKVTGIHYLEVPKVVYTSNVASNRAACVIEVWQRDKLSGEGILIGFIDTGIDYTLNAFRTETGETRIEYLYDLSQGGTVWNKAQINQALKAENPYSVINFRDSTGHGTHVAGIACAGGNIDVLNYGAAYKSSIAMVKITGAEGLNFSLSTQILRGIRFLLDKSRELNLPLVINLSWSSNDGSHNGSTILEQYISTVCSLERLSFVVSAGNEGDKDHHAGGDLRREMNIGLSVSPREKGVIAQLYKPLLTDLSIEITNPAGNRSGEILVNQGYREIPIGPDTLLFYYTGPKPFNLDGEIILTLVSNENFITEGQWNINLSVRNDYLGRFDMWLPIAERLQPKTRFLQPDVYNTLGIPATVANVISVGSYNPVHYTISPFSGRGIYGNGLIKPDVVAPGENIISTLPGGSFGSKTGTSMAAPHVSGICALLMQWGLVLGNDPFLYGERLKYYLLRGARRLRTNEDYPNPIWGYGTICALNAINAVKLGTGSRNNLIHGEDDVNGKLIYKRQTTAGEKYLNPQYANYLAEYQGNIIQALEASGLGSGFIVDDRFAVVSILRGREEEAVQKIKEIIYIDPGSIYTLCEISPLETAHILQFHNNPYLTLTGQGVLLGILDTGIDYMNLEFMYEDDTSKIIRLWDQNITTGSPPKDIPFGTEYTREQINEAIKTARSGGDPYSIVPSKDLNGHGTHMAGLMGGKGRNPNLVGAAPDSRFIIVKMKELNVETAEYYGSRDPNIVRYGDTAIVLALKYIYDTARELQTPVSILIPVGSNLGAHDGSSVLSQYIDENVRTVGVVVTVPTGNQGLSDTHASGEFEKTGEVKVIELRVAPGEETIVFEIWAKKPDRVSLGIVSPSGEIIDRIPAKRGEAEEVRFVYERTIINVRYFMPEEATGDELIRLRMVNVREGIWQFRLYGDNIIDGRYNAWLPQRELLKEGTEFLNSNQFTTLTLPSTSRGAISIGFYNQNNNVMVAASGRGYTRDDRVKPDLCAGGVEAVTTAVGGGSTTVSGSSVAAAVTAGAIALMLQWGIVDGNDPTLYSQKVKTYLIRGTTKREKESYPNPQWGYGELNLQGVFDNIRYLPYIREDANEEKEEIKYTDADYEPAAVLEGFGDEEYEEYYVQGMYVRKPSNSLNNSSI